MGNSAGWKHEARYTRCVGYLPERTHRALNKNARVKLHMDEAKSCILFSLVPRASESPRDQRALCRCWSYCILLLGYLFSSLQMVSGQQILEACMKNFFIILRLVVQIHALRENGFEDLKAWIHICLPSVIFIFISERETLLF